MTEAVRLLDFGGVAPLRSQALYHGLAWAATERTPDTIVLCHPTRPYFCVGFHQNPSRELDLDFCRAQGYPVFHRRIGGGSVYLDRDQLFYQVILHSSRAPWRVDAIYQRYLAGPVAALRGLGLPAVLAGSNEIEVGGRRIAGTGGGQIGNGMALTGNLLLDFPYEVMTRAWSAPSEAFRELAGDGLRQSLTTLRRELSRAPGMDALKELVVRGFEETLGCSLRAGELTPAEREAVAGAEERLLRRSMGEQQASDSSKERTLKIARDVYVREIEVETPAGPERRAVRVRAGVTEESRVSAPDTRPSEVEGPARTRDSVRRGVGTGEEELSA